MEILALARGQQRVGVLGTVVLAPAARQPPLPRQERLAEAIDAAEPAAQRHRVHRQPRPPEQPSGERQRVAVDGRRTRPALAPGRGRDPVPPREGLDQVTVGAEADGLGDPRQRQVGVLEQLLGVPQPRQPDLLRHRPPPSGLEAPQELTRAQPHRLGDVRHADRPVAAAGDVVQCPRHRPVAAEPAVGRGPRHQGRAHQHVARQPRPARHQAVQEHGRLVAHLLEPQVDTRQRHRRPEAGHGVVPHPHDPHVLGHPQPPRGARLRGVERQHVRRCEDPERWLELAEQPLEPLAIAGPPLPRARRPTDVHRQPRIEAWGRVEQPLLELRRRHAVGRAPEGHRRVAARRQMLARQHPRLAPGLDDPRHPLADVVHRRRHHRRARPPCGPDERIPPRPDRPVELPHPLLRERVMHQRPPSRMLLRPPMDPPHPFPHPKRRLRKLKQNHHATRLAHSELLCESDAGGGLS